jgi:arylsulfatase A-like enzyme
MTSDRRTFLKTAAGAASLNPVARAASSSPPNVIVILADDLGYGDLGCYGSGIATPNLDRMAAEGMRFTQFNSTSSVCSPSRAAWMTGRYPTRTGIPRVLNESDTYGIPDTETTMAQMLKGAGYSTACIGKWHLGHLPQYLPTAKGFDEFFGIPYSTDQGTRPLMQGLGVLEEPANLEALTERYTSAAVDFIGRSRGKPFFLHIGHAFPHLPLAASARFAGRSLQGLYGDAVQEMDWSVGQIFDALRYNGVDSNTLVVFSSDHGPWFQGSPGRLRGRKGEVFEGGVRVPMIARYPEFIPRGRVSDAFTTSLDIMPTVASLTRTALPPNPMDGVDLRPLLSGEQTTLDRDVFLYFNDVYLQAARLGSWKLHLARFNAPPFVSAPAEGRLNLPLPGPELYDVLTDVDESHDRSLRNPAVVRDLRARVDRMMQTFPTDVQQAFARTETIKVQGTPAGCFPTPRT